ncbi:4,5-DOPA dioxygenase extradiol-like [Chenopodium quinoa]|uniref:4,5-DOPA dioxygenase extradiol-like n=1 Tax=Chenopodium quinoa TaxID=63459 RepID=UPI000B7908F4|nr:4,5-DOPA dioxygenase extradiol-like [Chenopodium quinoa]
MGEEEKMKETFFITHGCPKLTIEEVHPLHSFFKSWKENVYSKKPKAILVISSHWITDQPAVNSVHLNDTIYDYEGVTYPASLYQVKYPAPGAPNLAKKVEKLLNESGFESVYIDKKRVLSHATWVPLMLMYPEADISVCELSVQPHLDGMHHYNLGLALAPLKDDGVLIIGSGSGATHPSWDTTHDGDGVAPWAAEFDSWLDSALTNGRYEEVNECETKAPNWKLAHPMPDHFYPLHVAIGAAGEDCKAELVHSSWYSGVLTNGILSSGTLKHGSYKFTSS